MVSLPSVNNKKCIKTMITKEDTTLNQNTEPHLVHIHDVHLDDDYTQWLVELKTRY